VVVVVAVGVCVLVGPTVIVGTVVAGGREVDMGVMVGYMTGLRGEHEHRRKTKRKKITKVRFNYSPSRQWRT
jgi:hypothetical protein